MALDDASAGLLAQLRDSGAKPLHELTVAEARVLGANLSGLFGTGPEMLSIRDVAIADGDADCHLRLLAPSASPRGVIVYFHGGGRVMGSVAEVEVLGKLLAKRTDLCGGTRRVSART